MYLVTKDNLIHTATKDIKVYKVGNIIYDQFIGLIPQHKYEPGVLQETIRLTPTKNRYGDFVTEHGYHSYGEVDGLTHLFVGNTIGVFIIPRGAKYLTQINDELTSYVSSTIIYKYPYDHLQRIPHTIVKTLKQILKWFIKK